jgi:prepilin-type N-terminal cleavage/methylation domain-containing protein
MATTKRTGMSLIEVLAALVIAATIAALGIHYLRPAGDTGKQRTCDMTREILQTDARRFTESTGRPPSRNLRQLRTNQYSGTVLPTCPVTGQSYRLDRSGIVTCPTHEATRVK